jgi:hypothetical protein
MANPTRFFNVSYNFDLGQAANGGYPYRRIQVDNCFFVKRDGTFVNTTEELNNGNEDVLIVRRGPQGDYNIPDVANFDNYPELFDPNNPDADRNNNGINEPYKITDVTKGEIENFSSRYVNTTNGGKRRKQTKRRKHTKRRKQTKRRRHTKRRR